MSDRFAFFAFITLTPVFLLVGAAFLGGWLMIAALVYMTVLTFFFDEMTAHVVARDPKDDIGKSAGVVRLPLILAVAHFGLLVLAIWALTGTTGLLFWERVVAFFAFGLFFGQVSNSVAHELIHRPGRVLRRLGMWVFISHLFGHHTSAHLKVHHPLVGSDGDPNSARQGESFYEFAPRAWIGSFRAGLRAETAKWQKSPDGWVRHPYVLYLVGALGFVGLAWLIAGLGGVISYVALAAYATMQLLMSDYVQHYGLTRRETAPGRLEPSGPRHSWNAPYRFSAHLMLNAPRHSDHHAHPGRTFPELRLDDNMPMLPRSLPVMGFVALFPRRWRQLMDPKVAKWTNHPLTAE